MGRTSLMPPEMPAADSVELLRLFEAHGLQVCVDGGWAVDALLGEQTRPHADLDIALPHSQVPALRRLLEARGFTDVPRDDSRDCNFVLGDSRGRQVDIHSYTFDAEGKLTFGVAYPFDSLNGTGSILGHPVRCITPEWLVRFHTGYKVDGDDYRDVKALCARFDLPLPEEYGVFEQAGGS